jgi:acylphosphatase
MLQTISIRVTGLVQGVNFRRSTLKKAVAAGLTGYVKNRTDGSVFITASGDAEALALLTAWCRVGPPGARVSSVEVTEQPFSVFEQFSIER